MEDNGWLSVERPSSAQIVLALLRQNENDPAVVAVVRDWWQDRQVRDPKSARLRPHQVARIVGRSVWALAKDRARGRGLPYTKIGYRTVVYDAADVAAWLASRRRTANTKSKT